MKPVTNVLKERNTNTKLVGLFSPAIHVSAASVHPSPTQNPLVEWTQACAQVFVLSSPFLMNISPKLCVECFGELYWDAYAAVPKEQEVKRMAWAAALVQGSSTECFIAAYSCKTRNHVCLLLQPFFQELPAPCIIIADSMPRRSPLKEKIAAAYTVFIKYYCCSLEEQEDPLPNQEWIQHHLMVAIAINCYSKAKATLAGTQKRKRERWSRERVAAELSPSV